jgi:hypothetical protein
VELDISSAWPSALAALASLDDSLALYRESLQKLSAADSLDIAEVIEQFEMAAESARNLRALISSERPEASWQNREELDALIGEEIRKSLEARDLEQRRFRLLALATELERGSIARRRAQRANQLNQLREQAVSELRSTAAADGAPQILPGPESEEWIAWACGLQEPEDAESLQTLREGFPHLDEFVADLDSSLWIPAGSEAPETVAKPPQSAGKTPPGQSRPETKPLEESAVSSAPTPIGLKEVKLPGEPGESPVSQPLDSRAETVAPAMDAEMHPPLVGLTGVVTEPARQYDHPVESAATPEVFHEASSEPAIAADVTPEVEAPWDSPRGMRYNSVLRGNPLAMTLLRPEADLLQSRRVRNTVWAITIGALITAVATLFFGISLYRQMRKLSAQVTQSSEASRLAIQDGIRTDQRAWVGLTEATVHPLNGDGGGFTIKLQNTGKTPATDLKIADVITIEDTDALAPLQEPNITTSAGTLLPGAVYTADVWFKTSPEVVAGLTQERLRAANYVYVTYKDVFKQTHTTKACFYWHGGMAKTKPCDRYNELN